MWYTIWSPEHELQDESGNSHFSFHLVIWERYKAAHAVRDCKNFNPQIDMKEKIKNWILGLSSTPNDSQLIYINKSITARLRILPKFSRDSGMSLHMHYVNRAWHCMVGNVIGKLHSAPHTEELTFSFFKLWNESNQSRCHPCVTHVLVTIFLIWVAFLKVFLLSDLVYYLDLWFHPSVKIIVLVAGDVM